MGLSALTIDSAVQAEAADFDRPQLEDIGYMTCMTLVLLGNYAQTGHFGGPLAYTPYNVAAHLAGPELRRHALRLPPPQASRSATSSCWRAATMSPRATRCG